MRYWLYKTEPTSYNIDDLVKDGSTVWDGVRNFMARNYLVEGEIGDRVFFYHSSAKPPGIAGLASIIEDNVVDPTQFDPGSKYYDPTSPLEQPRWITVRVGFVQKFTELIPLDRLRTLFTPEELPILRKGSRLSVTPVPIATADQLMQIGQIVQ